MRYLWARHRIALLSDYNRLSPSDERVKEVTNLGLTYNLLTAYTSFVAIDTEIRLKDGQATTVRQPLPLPQGVSDLAVGGNAFAKQSTAYYAPGRLRKGEALALREVDREVKDKRPASEPESPKPALEKAGVEIEKITVSEGMSTAAVKKVIEKHIRTIKLCYQQALGKSPKLKGKIGFEWIIDRSGRVVKVKVVKKELNNKELEQCMIQKMKTLVFPVPEGGKAVTVTVTFELDYR